MNEKQQTTADWGTPMIFITFFIFLVLKVLHYIDWSWWIIFLPLIIPVGITILSLIIVAIVYAITGRIGK